LTAPRRTPYTQVGTPIYESAKSGGVPAR